MMTYNGGGKLNSKGVTEVLEDTNATCLFAPPTTLNIIIVNHKDYDQKEH
jgi:acetyl-CoA synthetase